jgi:iron complex outermembrane receptor protein
MITISARGSRNPAHMISLAALAFALAGPAFAQDQSTTAEVDTADAVASDQDVTDIGDIVVTGTLIRGIAPVGAPVLGVSSEEIKKSGVANTVELLRAVPQVANIGMDQGRSNSGANLSNANTTYGSGINLRGLGTQATLTLINGRRPAPNGLSGIYFDPAAIPTIALGGVEIVADGSSALYGSDAITGVVNLLLRKNVEGLEVSARYGMADDYDSRNLAAIYGRNWGSGSVMIAAENSYHSALWAEDRPDLYEADQRAYGGRDQRSLFTSPGNIVVGSTIYGVPTNAGSTPLTFADLSTTPNRLSGWAGTTAIPEQERNSIVGSFDQQLNDSVRLYAQGFLSKRDLILARGNLGKSGVESTLTIRNTNPFFITGVPGAATSQTVRYNWADSLGVEETTGDQLSYQAVAGMEFQLPRDWRANLTFTRAYSEDTRNRWNQVNTCALQGAATRYSGACTVLPGQVAGGALAQTSAALAFNPFGTNSAAVLDSIRASFHQKNSYTIDDIQAVFDGRLFTLPAGEVRAAFGVGFANHETYYHRWQNTDTADNTYFRNVMISGLEQQATSLFAELNIPVISADMAIPGVESLRISVAGRVDDYSIAGRTTNPKVGFTWDVDHQLTFRGSYGSSFRVALVQMDPWSAGGTSLGTAADYASATGTSVYAFEAGGNEALEPESSETFTFGADYKPDWAPGLKLTASYFNIDYKDIIDTPGTNLRTTGISSAERERLYAPYIVRRPTDAAGSAAFTRMIEDKLASPLSGGSTIPANSVNVYYDGRSWNAGQLKVSGLDLQASYSHDTDFGSFSYGVMGTYYIDYQRSLTPGGELEDKLNLIEFPTQYTVRANIGWSTDNWSANAYVNYKPSYTSNLETPSREVDAYTTVDGSVRYAFSSDSYALRDVVIGVEVQNLFDKDPPLALVGNQVFDSSNGSALGRIVALRVSKAF